MENICPICRVYISSLAAQPGAAPTCPRCGFVFVAQPSNGSSGHYQESLAFMPDARRCAYMFAIGLVIFLAAMMMFIDAFTWPLLSMKVKDSFHFVAALILIYMSSSFLWWMVKCVIGREPLLIVRFSLTKPPAMPGVESLLFRYK